MPVKTFFKELLLLLIVMVPLQRKHNSSLEGKPNAVLLTFLGYSINRGVFISLADTLNS